MQGWSSCLFLRLRRVNTRICRKFGSCERSLAELENKQNVVNKIKTQRASPSVQSVRKSGHKRAKWNRLKWDRFNTGNVIMWPRKIALPRSPDPRCWIHRREPGRPVNRTCCLAEKGWRWSKYISWSVIINDGHYLLIWWTIMATYGHYCWCDGPLWPRRVKRSHSQWPMNGSSYLIGAKNNQEHDGKIQLRMVGDGSWWLVDDSVGWLVMIDHANSGNNGYHWSMFI